MAKRVSVDRWMFTVTAILVFIGLVMVFSASAVMAKERYRIRLRIPDQATDLGRAPD